MLSYKLDFSSCMIMPGLANPVTYNYIDDLTIFILDMLE